MTIRPLSPELAEKARLELNEDQKRIPSDLQHLREWLAKQPHLRARRDDQWLVAFLRGCKYSLERTKEKLDLYYSLRTIAPELFNIKYDNPNLYELLNIGAYIVLPKTVAPDSPRVTIMRPGAIDPDKISMREFFSIITVLQKIILNDDDTTAIAGTLFVIDLKDVTFTHLVQLTPTLLKKMSVQGQDAAPIRMKGNYFVNTPPGFDTFFNTLKSFLNEKNKNRMFICKSNEELYKYIPKEILPKDYGGDSESVAEIIDNWKAKIQEYSSWLEEDEKYGTDETKRLGQPKTAETLFGVEGSFRQLGFD